MANKVISSINAGSGDIGVFTTPYGVCDTAADTAAKVVTVQGDFALELGATVIVKFSKINAAANPTLNVNGSGAKPIVQYGTTAVGTSTPNAWNLGAAILFVYDGTSWVRTYNDTNTDNNQKVKAGSVTFGASDTVNFVAGSNVTVTGNATNDTITIASSYTDTNQTIKGNGTTFGTNDAIDIVPGSNITITPDATNKKITIAGTDTHYESKNIVGASDSATANAAVSGNGNVYLNHVENGSVTSSNNIVGSGSVTVTSGSTGRITITGEQVVKKGAGSASIVSVAPTASTASGDYGISLGSGNSVAQKYGVALGVANNLKTDNCDQTQTVWGSSFAAGWKNNITSDFGIAIGSTNSVDGDCAIALGYNNDSSGNYSASIGASNILSGERSFAVGLNNEITKSYGFALGEQNTVKTGNGVAIGSSNTLETYGGGYSVAFGQGNNIERNTAFSYVFGADNKINFSEAENGSNGRNRYNFFAGYGNSVISGDSRATGCVAMGINNTVSSTNYGGSAGTEPTSAITGTTRAQYCSVALGCTNVAGTTGGAAGYAIGAGNSAVAMGATAIGYANRTTGSYSVVMGYTNEATGSYATAMGYSNYASGNGVVVLGYDNTVTSSNYSTAIGYGHSVNGANNFVGGYDNSVIGTNNTVIGTDIALGGSGSSTTSPGYYCTLFGRGHRYNNTSTSTAESATGYPSFITVIGRYAKYNVSRAQNYESLKNSNGNYVIHNDAGSNGPYLFVVGNGTSTSNYSHAAVVSISGNMSIAGSYYPTSSADYAECFEWSDGNLNEEDRRGRFVTIDKGDTIRLANADDDYILGIVSATPCIVGDSQNLDWQGRYKKDIYGQILYEDYEMEAEYDEEGNVIVPATIVPKPVDSEEYDSEKEYIPRLNRKEWTTVGMLGKLVLDDDGTCEVGGFAAPGKDGIATRGTSINGYKVIARLDENHVKVIFK